MNDKEQAYRMLKDTMTARLESPWTAMWFEGFSERDHDGKTLPYALWMGPRMCLHRLGGLASEW